MKAATRRPPFEREALPDEKSGKKVPSQPPREADRLDRLSESALMLQRSAGNSAVASFLSGAADRPSGSELLRQTKAPPARKARAKHVESDPATVTTTAQAIADVLQHRSLRLLGQVDGQYRDAVAALRLALVGSQGGKELGGEQRLALLEDARKKLDPVLEALAADPDEKAWLDTEITPYLAPLRDTFQVQIAEERVKRTELVGDKAIEPGAEGDVKAEKEALHASSQKLLKTVALLNEQIIRMGHDVTHEALHHLAKEFEKGHYPKELKKEPGDPGFLIEVQNLLFFVDGMLSLSDEELARELAQPHGFFGGVATISEFLKAVTEMFGGLLGISFSFAAVIAKLHGEAEYAVQAMGYARGIGLTLGNVVAGIEIVHGVAVILDEHASDQQKVEAGRDVVAGTAWFVGARAGGAVVGSAASIAVLITYKELELMADLYGKALTGIVGGWMSAAYETMADAAQSISADGRELAKAGYLGVAETDPERHRALAKVEAENARRLASAVDYFLEQCEPVGYGAGAAYKPGAHGPLRKVFAPLLKLKGTTNPEATAAAATEVLKAIQYCFEHSQELLNEATGREPKRHAEGGGHEEKHE